LNVYQEVRRLDKGKCRVWGCGKNGCVQVHHIIPRSQGGPDKEWNLICLCSRHHEGITCKKMSNVDMLNKLKKKRDFRWGKALEWHLKREEIRKLNKVGRLVS